MELEIILQIVLLGIALSMDAFAVSITDGLIYTDIDKKKSFFIAGVFGFMQAFMPLVGYWIVEAVQFFVQEGAGDAAINVMSQVVTWIAFVLLIFIGGKMLIDAIKEIKESPEDKVAKKFSVKEVLIMGVATAIDALAVGVTLHAGLSTNTTVWFHVVIIMVCTFVISLCGLFLGKAIDKMLKGKYEISSIIGGSILIVLAVWVVLSHYLGI